MPKINSAGQPSYGGVSGRVTNATGQQFELDPNVNVDGTDADNAQPVDERVPLVSLDGPDQLTPSTNTDADLADNPDAQPVDEPADQQDKDADDKPDTKDDADSFDPAAPKPAGNQTPAFLPKKAASKPAAKSTDKK